jgi:hypothetical protein
MAANPSFELFCHLKGVRSRQKGMKEGSALDPYPRSSLTGSFSISNGKKAQNLGYK